MSHVHDQSIVLDAISRTEPRGTTVGISQLDLQHDILCNLKCAVRAIIDDSCHVRLAALHFLDETALILIYFLQEYICTRILT